MRMGAALNITTKGYDVVVQVGEGRSVTVHTHQQTSIPYGYDETGNPEQDRIAAQTARAASLIQFTYMVEKDRDRVRGADEKADLLDALQTAMQDPANR